MILNRFVKELSEKAPNLVTLDVKCGYWKPPSSGAAFAFGSGCMTRPRSVARFEYALCRMILKLPHLHRLVLPPYWLTTTLAEAASQHPNLAIIEYQYEPFRGVGNPLDTITFAPNLRAPSFRLRPSNAAGAGPRIEIGPSATTPPAKQPFAKLVDISVCTTFHSGGAFLRSLENRGSHLTHVSIGSTILESPESYKTLIQVIASQCQFLVHLSLLSLCTSPDKYQVHELRYPKGIGGPSASVAANNPNSNTNRAMSGHRITYSTIKPLEAMQHLINLELSHHRPVSLSRAEFTQFVRAIGGRLKLFEFFGEPWWSAIEEEEYAKKEFVDGWGMTEPELDEMKDYGQHPVLGLRDAIKTVALYCPNLENLTLFVRDDTSSPASRFYLDDDLDMSTPPLPDLLLASFGPSPVSNPSSVALFLSHYLPATAEIAWGVRYGGDESKAHDPGVAIREWKRRTLSAIRRAAVVGTSQAGVGSGSDGGNQIKSRWVGLDGGNRGHTDDVTNLTTAKFLDDDDDDDDPVQEYFNENGGAITDLSVRSLRQAWDQGYEVPSDEEDYRDDSDDENEEGRDGAGVGRWKKLQQELAGAINKGAASEGSSTTAKNLPPSLQTLLPLLLPPSTSENHFIFGIDGHVDAAMTHALIERSEGWYRVHDLIPVLSKMREEERKRVRGEVEREIRREKERKREEQESREREREENEKEKDRKRKRGTGNEGNGGEVDNVGIDNVNPTATSLFTFRLPFSPFSSILRLPPTSAPPSQPQAKDPNVIGAGPGPSAAKRAKTSNGTVPAAAGAERVSASATTKQNSGIVTSRVTGKWKPGKAGLANRKAEREGGRDAIKQQHSKGEDATTTSNGCVIM